MTKDKRITVDKILPGMDRTKIHATTGQMRNFYQQMGDGYFTVLDVMNYMQHHAVVRMARKDYHVLDMCCGRGLLLPMLRYYAKTIGSYTGVDLEKSNAIFRKRRVHNNKPAEIGYYPFPVYFAHCDVSEMTAFLPTNRYDLVVYTSAIEHMHPETGLQSLHEAYTVAAPGAKMVLTCPNTPEDQDGFDTQYSHHVYEWKRSEIEQALKETGWQLEDVYGLLVNVRALKSVLTIDELKVYEHQATFIPSVWLTPMYAVSHPEASKELAYICNKKG